MDLAALNELLKLKLIRERGLRYKLSAIDRREAALTDERRRSLKSQAELRVERDALFTSQPVVEPGTFKTLKYQLARLYEQDRAADERVVEIHADLQEGEEDRRARTAELNRNLRGQEKLTYLLGKLDGRYTG
ncbi:hypothetical protein B0G84_9138 [Paraburkholderia sp. BL8N3]|nr:hypothetical protein [Paraburkholderia sp. BL8N3]TCK32010.1 hypothetical protein B0G84_9138 [Paraburkholderia sp. BL8N3]